MDSTAKKSCLPIIILILLAPIVHGARHAPDVKGTTGTDVAGDDGEDKYYCRWPWTRSLFQLQPPVVVAQSDGNPRTVAPAHPAVVDHHNMSPPGCTPHHHRGAASRRAAAVGYDSLPGNLYPSRRSSNLLLVLA
ncbi:hypothetical protein GUJ93_ZPchr0269g2883 [Zizania palustris]|uniref:Uncharacterized protein n=1 Tax=Zizania palustris TaxID=103762 RepID=A0A8J5QUG6_ZIZPA|nr:hypothetical protein GUJ93_ZPchr0269g2883 [Zizania palustris]